MLKWEQPSSQSQEMAKRAPIETKELGRGDAPGAEQWGCTPPKRAPLPRIHRKRAYSKEAVYSDKLQHYSTGRGE